METENGMTERELYVFLMTLAELIEAKAKTPEDAAKIIMDKAEMLKD